MLVQPTKDDSPGIFIDRLKVDAVSPVPGINSPVSYEVVFSSGAKITVCRGAGERLLAEIAGK